MTSPAHDLLLFQIKALGLPEPNLEFRFHKTRRWRFDAAYPSHKLAIEVSGAVWTQGRHTRGEGYSKDCVKYNEAAIQGWRVLHFTTAMVESGEAMGVIERALR